MSTSTPACDSLSVDELFSHVQPYASKWFNLGKELSLDDGQLNEILYTNSDRDEESLRAMLELYTTKSCNPSWDAVKVALKKIDPSKLQQE